MGSNDYDSEKPPHTVILPAYRIAKMPVMVAQFAQFVKATGYTTTAEQQGSAWGWNGKEYVEIQGRALGALRTKEQRRAESRTSGHVCFLA
ncbi:MAG: SUMF1/EgtB/PvdO family nonheme iron enzyme [Caldilineaceae bacterium]